VLTPEIRGPAPGAAVTVLGAGVVGMSVAIELARAGLAVRVLERGDVGAGASHGNAGLLVPSYSRPLARPAALLDGLAAALGRGRALGLGPWQGAGELTWLLRFAAACRPGRGAGVAARLHRLALDSLAWYSELAAVGPGDFDLRRTGWLALFRTPASLRRGLAEARWLAGLGVRWQRLSPAEVPALAPGLEGQFAGAILHPDDWAISPDRLMERLGRTAQELGVQLLTGTEVAEVRTRGPRATALRGRFGEHPVGQLVLAAGWETERWLRRLGRRGGIWPGRGYSITVAGGPLPRPLNIVDLHLVISAPGERVRATSGLDLGRASAERDRQRVEELRSAARSVLPHLSWDSPIEEWAGSRPMTPSGVPLVGRVRGWENVLVASGHGMLGMSLAPASAREVRRLITGGQAAARR
jgi:D-amino-acid dehydrogenase